MPSQPGQLLCLASCCFVPLPRDRPNLLFLPVSLLRDDAPSSLHNSPNTTNTSSQTVYRLRLRLNRLVIRKRQGGLDVYRRSRSYDGIRSVAYGFWTDANAWPEAVRRIVPAGVFSIAARGWCASTVRYTSSSRRCNARRFESAYHHITSFRNGYSNGHREDEPVRGQRTH